VTSDVYASHCQENRDPDCAGFAPISRAVLLVWENCKFETRYEDIHSRSKGS